MQFNTENVYAQFNQQLKILTGKWIPLMIYFMPAAFNVEITCPYHADRARSGQLLPVSNMHRWKLSWYGVVVTAKQNPPLLQSMPSNFFFKQTIKTYLQRSRSSAEELKLLEETSCLECSVTSRSSKFHFDNEFHNTKFATHWIDMGSWEISPSVKYLVFSSKE